MHNLSRLSLWSSLPTELLLYIVKLFDKKDDTLRIRSVCSSWRSSIPPPPMPKKLSFPLLFSLPNSPEFHGYLKLTTMTIFRLHSSTVKNRRNWCLVRVQETQCGNFQVSNLFGGRIVLPRAFPQHLKVINPLAFYKTEMTNGYQLSMVSGPFANVAESACNNSGPFESAYNNCGPSANVAEPAHNNAYKFRKVIVSSQPVSTADDYLVIALNSRGVLFHTKLGDDRWNMIERINLYGELMNFAACDIIEHMGRFYVVSKKNMIVILDYSLEVIELMPFRHCGESPCDLYLVESKGGLFLVHKHWFKFTDTIGKAFEIRVYKLEDRLHGWGGLTLVKNLDGDILFLCHDSCFSISTQDFPGLKGNCVYFMHDSTWEFANDAICRGLKDFPIYAYNLEDASVGPLLAHPDNSSILWSVPHSDAN